MRTWFASAVCGIAVLSTVPSPAMEPMPLPAFEVRRLTDVPVASGDLGPAGRWLIVYVKPHSAASELLLKLVKKEEDAAAAPRIVVIVGGTLAEAQAVCDAFPALEQGSWYADPDGSALLALGLPGAPTALGLRERTIEWKAAGMLVDPKTVKSVLMTWVAE